MTQPTDSTAKADPAMMKSGRVRKADQLHRHARQPGRDDRLDEELERERLEPGLDTEGTGGAGAEPRGPRDGGNSNT